ncbi:MAG TPA: hypothetical protein VF661_12090 [Actinomycetales bacterium]
MDDDEQTAAAPAGPDAATFRVQMLGVPLELRERSRQQGADLLREMALVRGGPAPTAGHGPPARLLELADELDRVYGPYVAASDEEMDAAAERGDAAYDVAHQLPVQAVPFVEHVRDLLEEVEHWCRSDGYLLTLAPPPDVAAYRDWSMQEVVRQGAGEPPVPWPDYARAHLQAGGPA